MMFCHSAVLRLVPSDQDALRMKLVVAIESGNIDEALQILTSAGNPEELAFERAYCLYRQGNIQEALQTLKSVSKESEEDSLHLEAQLHYRIGANEKAIAIYRRLFSEFKLENQQLATNVAAAYIAAGAASELPAVLGAMRVKTSESYELAFNAACGLIEQNSLQEAEAELQVARRTGEEALYEEELDADEVNVELAPIDVQLAYVAERQYHTDEAIESLQDVLELELDNDATASIATNNMYAALLKRSIGNNSRRIASEALKKLDAFTERSGGLLKIAGNLDSRLGVNQREALLASYGAAALLAHKSDVAREAVRSLGQLCPGASSLPPLQAAVFASEGKFKEADAALKSSNLEDKTVIAILRAQLAAVTGDSARALDLLGELPRPHKPAILCTRIALMEHLGDYDAALDALTEALEGSFVAATLKTKAKLELRIGDLKSAVMSYTQYLSTDGVGVDDADALTGLVRAAALAHEFIPENIISPMVLGMGSSEIDTLESLTSALGDRKGAVAEVPIPASKKRELADGEELTKKRKKRKGSNRKKFFEKKGWDINNPPPAPDPERWLPKWERAESRKLRKKKKDKDAHLKGGQGSKVDESLDRSKAVPMAVDGKAGASKPKTGKKKGKGKR